MMTTKKFSTLQLIGSLLICSIATIVICFLFLKKDTEAVSSETTDGPTDLACDIVAHRLSGYKYVKPVLYNDRTCESERYSDLKGTLMNIIANHKTGGDITSGSVYLKLLNTREYIGIDETQKYHPASLIKLPMLIAYLKMDEAKPGFLNKKLTFNTPLSQIPKQTYNSKQIQYGKSYTIKELLKYMVAYSDNNATMVLNQNVDLNLFKKMFADLGLTIPNVTDMNYSISPKEYTIFLNVVYNASYISVEHSELVAEILNESDFKLGMKSGIPTDVNIVHKFGEWASFTTPKIHQFSESAIVYLENCPYLLTVMTEGNDVKKLPAVIGEISRTVYNKLYQTKDNNL